MQNIKSNQSILADINNVELSKVGHVLHVPTKTMFLFSFVNQISDLLHAEKHTMAFRG